MNDNSTANTKNNKIIDRVEVSSDTLTSRGGLSLFVRYLRNIGLLAHLEFEFGDLRKSRKGQTVTEIFKQLFASFWEIGTSVLFFYI